MGNPTSGDSQFPFKDRRTFSRKNSMVPVYFMGQEVDSHLFTIDVGGGGVHLYIRKPLDTEKTHEVGLLIGGEGHPVPVKARVAWQRRLKVPDEIYEVGLVFQNFPVEHRDTLRDYLKSWTQIGKDERRRFLRVPRILQARVIDELKEVSFTGYVLDISPDGVRFITAAQLEEKNMISLKIELEEGSGITVGGNIAWRRQLEPATELVRGMGYIYGMKFQVTSVELQSFINSYVDFRNRFIEAALVETLLSVKPDNK